MKQASLKPQLQQQYYRVYVRCMRNCGGGINSWRHDDTKGGKPAAEPFVQIFMATDTTLEIGVEHTKIPND
jgi:hypothetical protein